MENQPPIQPNQFSSTPQVPLPNGTAALVLGIISIPGCICYGIPGLICGIIALVLSNKDMKLYKLNPAAYTTGSLSNLKAGKVCAIIGLCLSVIYFVFIVIFILSVGFTALSDPQHIWEHWNNR